MKYDDQCFACGVNADLIEFRGVWLCKNCFEDKKVMQHRFMGFNID